MAGTQQLLQLSVLLVAVQAFTSGFSNPLHDAAVNQDLVLLKQLLDSGKYDVNGLDANGRTPLAAAMATCSNYTGRFPRMVPHGELQFCEVLTKSGIAEALVCAGADVNIDVFPKERPGYKLIHIAACSGVTEVHPLLAGGADPNAPYRLPDGRSVTPLTWAMPCEAASMNHTEYGYPGLNIETLLSAGADPLPFGPSNPPSALLYPQPQPLSKCNTPGACNATEVDRIMNSTNFPENSSRRYYWKDLWEAQEAKHADPQAQPVLANWVKRGRQGYACKNADDYLATELTRRKEEAERERYARAYPLHVAVTANNLTVVKVLLSSGKVDVNSKDDKGRTPLQAGMACADADYWCWPQIQPDVAEYLVSKGANVRLDVYPGSGYTLLHKAAFHGLTRLVQALLKGGADPNYDKDDKEHKDPQTPLTRAGSCDLRRSTNDGRQADSTKGTIQALLDAGAKLMPFGKDRPLTSFFSAPGRAGKCVKIGACTEAQLLEVMGDFQSGTCPKSFLLVWQLQEKQAKQAAAASREPSKQQSGRRLRAAVVNSVFA